MIEKTRAISIGDPTERGVYFGPVINPSAVATYERAVAMAKKDGSILNGGGLMG